MNTRSISILLAFQLALSPALAASDAPPPAREGWVASAWSRTREIAGSQGARTTALVVGAAAGTVAALAFLPLAGVAVAGKVVVGSIVGSVALNSARVGVAGDRNRAEGHLGHDAMLVASGGLGALGGLAFLPAAGPLATSGGIIARGAVGTAVVTTATTSTAALGRRVIGATRPDPSPAPPPAAGETRPTPPSAAGVVRADPPPVEVHPDNLFDAVSHQAPATRPVAARPVGAAPAAGAAVFGVAPDAAAPAAPAPREAMQELPDFEGLTPGA